MKLNAVVFSLFCLSCSKQPRETFTPNIHPNVQRISKSFEIISNPSGAKIEVNGNYIGETPCRVECITTGKGLLVEKLAIIAYPISNGQQTQFKWFTAWRDNAPNRVYFDMNLVRIKPDININLND